MARPADQVYSTTAIVKPSQPLLPTVWSAVALTRGSATSMSNKALTPNTSGSELLASTTAPSRTTLSQMMTAPGRESLKAHFR